MHQENVVAKVSVSSESQILEKALTAMHHASWVIGECAVEWCNLGGDHTIEAFADHLDMTVRQVQERKAVFEKFGIAYKSCENLNWSHFRQAARWPDAVDFLEWAEDTNATVREMEAYRRVKLGLDADDAPRQSVTPPRPPVVLDPVEARKADTGYQPFMLPKKKTVPEASKVEIPPKVAETKKPAEVSEEKIGVEQVSNKKLIEALMVLLDRVKETGNDRQIKAACEVYDHWLVSLSDPSQELRETVTETSTANKLVEAWNSIDGVVKVATLNKTRKSTIRARMKDLWWRENWKTAIAKIPGIGGLLGQNDKNWVANFDWFLRPATVASIIEGKYDHWKGVSGTTVARVATQNRKAFEEVLGIPEDTLPY